MQTRGGILMLTLGLCAMGVPVPSTAELYAPQVGKKHPDFMLPRIDTRAPVSLSQFRGKKVLLIQFASW